MGRAVHCNENITQTHLSDRRSKSETVHHYNGTTNRSGNKRHCPQTHCVTTFGRNCVSYPSDRNYHGRGGYSTVLQSVQSETEIRHQMFYVYLILVWPKHMKVWTVGRARRYDCPNRHMWPKHMTVWTVERARRYDCRNRHMFRSGSRLGLI